MNTKKLAKKIGPEKGEKGFTLIELIIVIVLLGILAAVAVPKYQDLKGDAEDAAADGVYGAALSAAAINFANRLISPGRSTIITGTESLRVAMGGSSGWADWEDSGATMIKWVASGDTYRINIDTVESSTAKAEISKDW